MTTSHFDNIPRSLKLPNDLPEDVEDYIHLLEDFARTYKAALRSTNIDPNTIPDYRLELTIDEIKSLARILNNEFISRDDSEAMAAVNKIFKYVEEHG
jgi:hypothetical protein